MFEKIKKFVELGLWNEEMVANVYKKSAITKEEYEQLKAMFV
ncbi:XkdX family protein [Methanobrevibacter sp.]